MGKERDSESDLDNFGARYYSSQMGRFMTPDWSSDPSAVPYAKLTDPQTLNLYAMVSDNPEASADLDGHVPGGITDISSEALSGCGILTAWCGGDAVADAHRRCPKCATQIQNSAQQSAQQQTGGNATASGIAGILCGKTCGETNSSKANESLDNARDKIAHVRLNGTKKWGTNVDKHAGMAPPNMKGAKAMLPIAERAIGEMRNGVDPTHGALLYNMRTAAQVKAGHDFWGYKVHTVSGPYNTPSPYKYIVTYGR